MVSIPIGQALGYPIGDRAVIAHVNPYAKKVTIEQGASQSFLSWDELKQAHGVEIVLTSDEEEGLARGALTRQIAEKARDLAAAIDNWLLNERGR